MKALVFSLVASCVSMTPAFSQSNYCDTVEKCQKVLEKSAQSSLAHYRLGEILFGSESYLSAGNEFRAALTGDLDPKWTEVWSHIALGKIFDIRNQRDRAVNEYRLAQLTKDNTRGARDQAAKYMESPFQRPSK